MSYSNFVYISNNHESTVTHLKSFLQFIAKLVDDLSKVDILYPNFSKILDRLDHNVMKLTV